MQTDKQRDRCGEGLVGTRGLVARRYNEWRQTGKWLREPHEWMPEKFRSRESPVDVHLQTVIEEVLEDRWQLVPLFDVRFTICCYQIQRLHHNDHLSSVILATVLSHRITLYLSFSVSINDVNCYINNVRKRSFIRLHLSSELCQSCQNVSVKRHLFQLL